MPYHSRKWNVTDVESPVETVNKIGRGNWCLCVGFRCQGLLWLNDSTSEDSVQEWALVREKDGRQCETLSMWGDPNMDEILKIHQRFRNGEKPMFGEGQMLEEGALDHPAECRLCA